MSFSRGNPAESRAGMAGKPGRLVFSGAERAKQAAEERHAERKIMAAVGLLPVAHIGTAGNEKGHQNGLKWLKLEQKKTAPGGR